MADLPGLWFSVDPGDVHVGLAVWSGARCREAVETRPDDMVDRLVDVQPRPALLVLEAFALRGNLMAEQQGSEFLTSQLIGALRHVCRRAQIPVIMQTPWQAKQLERLEPWRDWPLRAFVSYGQGRHAKDAELHGLKHIRTHLARTDRAGLADWLQAQHLQARRSVRA